MSNVSKPSVTDIVGLCGFALFTISMLVSLWCSYQVTNTINTFDYSDSGRNIQQELEAFDQIQVILGWVATASYVAIGYFFAMDMSRRDESKRILNILGIIGVVLMIAQWVRVLIAKGMDFETIEQWQNYFKISNYIWGAGFILVASYFIAYVNNAKLSIQAICAIALAVVGAAFAVFDVMPQYFLATIFQILAGASMSWFMYNYMYMSETSEETSATVTSAAKTVNIEPAQKSVAISGQNNGVLRVIAASWCLLLGLGIVFLPCVEVKWFGVQLFSLYDLMPHDWDYLFEGDMESVKLLRMIMATFIPAIILYAVSIGNSNKVCPIIGALLTLIPLFAAFGEDVHYSWVFYLLLFMYIVQIVLTILIAIKPQSPVGKA